MTTKEFEFILAIEAEAEELKYRRLATSAVTAGRTQIAKDMIAKADVAEAVSSWLRTRLTNGTPPPPAPAAATGTGPKLTKNGKRLGRPPKAKGFSTKTTTPETRTGTDVSLDAIRQALISTAKGIRTPTSVSGIIEAYGANVGRAISTTERSKALGVISALVRKGQLTVADRRGAVKLYRYAR
jgi:hypothetical protein